MDNRVAQVINHGSALLALEKNFITLEDLLQYLESTPCSENTVIAYRAACIFKNPNEHYIEGHHFLSGVKDPHYGAIFMCSGGNVETKIYQDSSVTDQIWLCLGSSFMKMQNDKNFEQKIKIICDRSDVSANFILESIPILFKTNSTNLIKKILLWTLQTIDNHLESIINSDSLTYLTTDKLQRKKHAKLFHLLLSRAETLINSAPLYWAHVIKDCYKNLFDQIIEIKDLEGTTTQDALKLEAIYPGIFKVPIDKLSDLAYRIFTYPLHIQSYLLGFPLHFGIPYQQCTIENKLIYLSTVGKEKYVEEFKKTEETTERSLFQVLGCPELQIRNTKDVLENEVYEYNSFDRLYLINGVNVYYFVRPEFENILKTNENIWTREKLPIHWTLQVLARQKMAKELNLPKPGTLNELLTKLENGEDLYPKENENQKDVVLNFQQALGNIFNNPNDIINIGPFNSDLQVLLERMLS